jgi:RNA polymerase sigma-70 factor (ECF subfamily)
MAAVDDLDRDFSAFRRNGDATALARVFDAAAPRLLLVASHWTQDPADAEDLVQVAFVQAVRDAAQWDETRPVLRWLAGIVAHRALDRRRQRRSERPTEAATLDAFAAPTPSPLAAAIDGEQLDRITQALARLEPPYQEVLVLRVLHGLQPTAIAHALGRAPATVRKQLERGLQQLRGLLPAALASAFVLLLPERGLAAMRAHVLAHVPGPTVPSPIGTLLMKKTLAAVLLLLVLAAMVVWQVLPATSSGPMPTPRNAAPVATATATTAPTMAVRERDLAPAVDAMAGTAGGSTLIVRVLRTADATPLLGVPVQLLPHDGTDERMGRRFATTDATGAATFVHLAAGTVVATLPTMAASEPVRIHLTAGEPREHTFSLAEARSLEGLVVAPDGRPVAGARVRVRPLGGSDENEQDHVAAESRDDGRFVLAVGSPVVEIAASHADYARSEAVAVHAEMPTESLQLVLRHAPVSLRGHVHCDGRAVGDARIRVAPPADQRRDGAVWRSDGGHTFARSSDDGRFLVDGLPAGGEAILTVLARGMVPFTTTVPLAPGEREVVVAMQRSPVVTGQVRSADGRPLGSATVRGGDAVAHCDDRGRFVLDCLAAGPTTLVASGVRTFAGSERQLVLIAGDVTEVAFTLTPLSMLAGRVVDEAGRPLADLVVTAFRQQHGPNFFRVEVDAEGRVDDVHGRSDCSGGDGTFTIPVLAGVDYVLTLQQKGLWFTTGGEDLGPFQAPRRDLVLTVPSAGLASGFVRGRLLAANGRPLAGATLQLGDGQRLATVGQNVGGPLRAPDDGTFTIGPVPARQYTLHVSASGGDTARFTTAPFEVAGEATLELGDVQAPATATLQLLVQADAELPSRPLLQCERRGGELEIHTFDERTSTTVRLVPGDYTVTVYGEGIVSETFGVSLAAGDVQRREVRLSTGDRFALDLTLPEDEKHATVTIRGPDGSVAFTTELERDDPFGSRWCPQLRRGAHEALLVCANGRRYVATFHVDGPRPSREDAVRLPWARQP